jgi:hypothetical protein
MIFFWWGGIQGRISEKKRKNGGQIFMFDVVDGVLVV